VTASRLPITCYMERMNYQKLAAALAVTISWKYHRTKKILPKDGNLPCVSKYYTQAVREHRHLTPKKPIRSIYQQAGVISRSRSGRNPERRDGVVLIIRLIDGSTDLSPTSLDVNASGIGV
jgi:hypothetical protein